VTARIVTIRWTNILPSLSPSRPSEPTVHPREPAGFADAGSAHSLPINLDGLTIKGEKVGDYFDNLLPDSDVIRQRIRSQYRMRTGARTSSSSSDRYASAKSRPFGSLRAISATFCSFGDMVCGVDASAMVLSKSSYQHGPP